MDIKQVQSMLTDADNSNQVLLIESLHGIGKSSVVGQHAAKNGMHFEPLILSLMDTGDLIGIPESESIGGLKTTTWAAPDWYNRIVEAAWPSELVVDQLTGPEEIMKTIRETAVDGYVTRENVNTIYSRSVNKSPQTLNLLVQEDLSYGLSKRSVLFLDEFNRSPGDILNASLQLVLDRRLHSHVLPRVNGKETMVVAAINPDDGNYTVAGFDPALLDRFVMCELEPDLKAWSSWAKDAGVNQIVRDYLIDNPKKLHFVPKDGGKGASPRSWEKLATYMDSINNKSDHPTFSYFVKGVIGDTMAAQFITYVNGYNRGMTVEELEKLVAKASKSTSDIEAIAKKISKPVEKLEAIKRMELMEQLADKYGNEKDPAKAMPYMAYLYALPLENLAATLKEFKTGKEELFNNLVKLDDKLNNKELLRRYVSKIKE